MESCLKSLFNFEDPDQWSLCSDTCLCHRYDYDDRKCPTSRVVHRHCLEWVTTRNYPTATTTRPTTTTTTIGRVFKTVARAATTTTTTRTTTTTTAPPTSFDRLVIILRKQLLQKLQFYLKPYSLFKKANFLRLIFLKFRILQ